MIGLKLSSPFVVVRLYSQRGKAHGVFVLHSTPDGLVLIRSKRERASINSELFDQIEQAMLAHQPKTVDRTFNESFFNQALSYLGPSIFKKNRLQGKNVLSSLEDTLHELHAIDPTRKVSVSLLVRRLGPEGGLTGFTIPAYRAYLHYRDRRIDINGRYCQLFEQHGNPLEAFGRLYRELKTFDPTAIHLRLLEQILHDLGHKVAYIQVNHRLYTYWQDRGFDVGKIFDEKIKSGGLSQSEAIALIASTLRDVGYPDDYNFASLPLEKHLFYILARLGVLGPIEDVDLRGLDHVDDDKGRGRGGTPVGGGVGGVVDTTAADLIDDEATDPSDEGPEDGPEEESNAREQKVGIRDQRSVFRTPISSLRFHSFEGRRLSQSRLSFRRRPESPGNSRDSGSVSGVTTIEPRDSGDRRNVIQKLVGPPQEAETEVNPSTRRGRTRHLSRIRRHHHAGRLLQRATRRPLSMRIAARG